MPKRLRIAVWYNLPSGGAKRALYYHLRGLSERGHHIEAWRPPSSYEKFSSLDGILKEHEVPLNFELADGSNYLDKIVRHVRRSKLLLDAMKVHSQICAREIASGEWDVLFANTDMYLSMPMIGRYVSLPKAVYLQEPHRPFYEPLPVLPWIALPESVRRSLTLKNVKKRIRDRFDLASARIQGREELESAGSYDRILVNSYFARESVLKAYGLNSEVCYLGIDTDKFKDLELPREKFIIGLGTVGPTKNVRLAIESVGAMPSPRPPLVWVGNMADEVYVQEMRLLADSLGVDFQIKVMVSDDELVRLLNTASLMFYAPRLEPFGLAPLEANACGLPAVAVAEGGVRETIVDGVNGQLGPHDPQALGEIMSRLMADPTKMRSLGETAKQLVHERWTVSSCVDRVEDALLRTAK